MSKKLTIKQEKFVQNYIEHGNGTKAAIDAGYSDNSAKAIASENLTKPYVAEQVHKYQSEAAAKVGLDQEYVLKHLKDWVEECDKTASIKALDMIGRHLQMFTDKVEVSIQSHEEALKELEGLSDE